MRKSVVRRVPTACIKNGGDARAERNKKPRLSREVNDERGGGLGNQRPRKKKAVSPRTASSNKGGALQKEGGEKKRVEGDLEKKQLVDN